MSRLTRRAGRLATAWSLAVLVVAGAALASLTSPGQAATQRFLASLRINRPQAVAVNIPSGAGTGYQLQEMLGGMLGDSSALIRAEPDRPASTPAGAAAMAGFAVQVPGSRHDQPTATVIGANDLSVNVNRSRLMTILAEAGMRDVVVPASVNGSTVTVHTPAAVRLDYGHCPAPATGTLASQIQGPPPLPENVADCIRLVEARSVVANLPAGIALGKLVEIALELSGLSPERAAAFQRRFDSHATLAMSLPRFVRSFDSVAVGGAPGLLFSSGGRRGPAYVLIWSKDGLAFSLTGYGNVADAVPLAAAIR